MNTKVTRLVLVFVFTSLLSGCSLLKSREPVVIEKIVYIKPECREFKEVVIPKFKNKKIKIKWGVNKDNLVVGLDNNDLIDVIDQNAKLLDQEKITRDVIDIYNKMGVEDANCTNK